ncbi:nicotinamide riboside transporter PnuC [Flavihumibacter solisilvae]|uniref:nicotinamide riboside transporter PnuC n=1 Tax=Flavihumibacter solisilvae TaxID=1349421 RepID=UPI000AF57398|nr:nicotinamide riboside transporter PnuC [Flavihumibacter solisilvae]
MKKAIPTSLIHAPDPGNAGGGKKIIMEIQQWAVLLWQQIKETDILQWLAVSFGVAEVLFAKANKIWLYPTGLVATILSVIILFEAGLYAECLLNGYYIIMSIYGWWYWITKKNKPFVAVTRCSKRDWIVVSAITFGGIIFLVYLLKQYTNSTVPYMDAWISATAWAGMWLLAKRKIENWILLNISNAFAIPLLFHKGLPLYALLTIFLFVVAITGYIKWNKIIKSDLSPGISYSDGGTVASNRKLI